MKNLHFKNQIKRQNSIKVLTFLFVFLLAFPQSCKKDDPLNPNNENNNPIDENLIALESKVELPEGSSLKTADLTFVTALDHEYNIAADGSVKFGIEHGGVSLASVFNANNEVLLMAWVDSTGLTSVSARTTAEVFTFS